MKKNDFLKKIFSEIKKDNLDNLKTLLHDNKAILFKNRQKENLLFYSLQSGSLKISQYLIEQHPEFLLETNNYLLTPFTDLIYKNNHKGFKAFLKLSQLPNISLKQIYNKGGEIYTTPLLAVEKLTKDNWRIYEDLTKNFWERESLIAKDLYGYNIAHKIAINNADYASSILNYLPEELFSQLDSELGSTPFLTALKFSELPLIKKFLPYSDIYQQTLLGSNAVHLSIFNQDISILKFVLEELKESPELITSSNLYGDSPLMSAINQHNTEALNLLIPYYITQNKDLSEEIIHFIKTTPKNFDKFKLFLNTIKKENIHQLLNNEEYMGVLFSYIFHYGLESDIKEFEKMFFWESLEKIQSKFLNHQIYSSTILGKKSINYKINYLLKKKNFLTSTDSQEVFVPNKDIELYFSNEDYRTFNKISKISSFVSSLNTMPGSQIVDLIKKTNFLDKCDDLDKLHLLAIGLRKENNDILSYIHLPEKQINTKRHMNCILIIQDLLSDYNYNPLFQNSFNNLISHLKFKPTRLFHNYIDKIFSSNPEEKMNKIYSVLSLFKDFPEYKKDFIHLLIYRLTQTNDNQEELLSLFTKNDKAVLSAIENIPTKHINKLKCNDFTKHLFSVYGERKNLIDLLIDIAHSDNINKYELMNFILPKCILNTSSAKRLSNKIKTKPIDDYGWSYIIENFKNNKSLHFLVDSYFASQENFENFSPNIINMIDYISESSKSHIYKKLTTYSGSKQQLLILNTLEKKMDFDVEKIVQDSIFYKNFNILSYFIEKKHFDINSNSMLFEKLWHTFDISNIFIDLQNKDKLTSDSLNNFFDFLEIQKENFSEENINTLTNSFIQWIEKIDTQENNIVMIRIMKIFFNIFKDKINIINENILLDTCKIVIKNNELNNLNSAHEEYEEILNNIFLNKEYNDNFFKQINNNDFFQENKDKFPENQLKRLQFYSLKDKYVPKTVKTKNIIKI